MQEDVSRMKNECIIARCDDIIDMDFVPVTNIDGDTWTAADVCFKKIYKAIRRGFYYKDNDMMFCDYQASCALSDLIKGWHLPTYDEAVRLVKKLHENQCYYYLHELKDRHPKARTWVYGPSISCIGDDCNFNAAFNGYVWNGIYRVENINKIWIYNQKVSEDNYKDALWITSQMVPNTDSDCIARCHIDAKYTVRLVKDKV